MGDSEPPRRLKLGFFGFFTLFLGVLLYFRISGPYTELPTPLSTAKLSGESEFESNDSYLASKSDR